MGIGHAVVGGLRNSNYLWIGIFHVRSCFKRLKKG